jgi:1,2-diacylglycerol 3-alpha-glucosyltransferase
MKIAMFTNTYLPHVGGVARSVHTLATECRRLSHEVKIVAPEFDGAEASPDVLRVPAIQKFNGSDFSVRLPIPNLIRDFMADFEPDVIHSHHPFLLGDSALREGWRMKVPVLFTHHTLYEEYTHYVPLDSDALKRAAIQLATGYGNLCNGVIAPSESVAKLLAARGVTKPIHPLATGIDTSLFSNGEGLRFRKAHRIPPDSHVIGHVGRLAHEKNLIYLTESIRLHLRDHPGSVFLLVGTGDAVEDITGLLSNEIEDGRVFAVGSKTGTDLVDAYAAMDVFVFASRSETQGIVLAEAMAAGVPVVAIDGPGVREIMADGRNGIMLDAQATPQEFAAAVGELADDPDYRMALAKEATLTAAGYDQRLCSSQVVACYESAMVALHHEAEMETGLWDRLLDTIEIEWELLSTKTSAAVAAISPTRATEVLLD